MLGYSQEKEYDIELYYSSSRKIGTEERPATYKAAKYLVNKLNNMINFNPLHSLQTLLKHYDNNHVPAFVELWINEKYDAAADNYVCNPVYLRYEYYIQHHEFSSNHCSIFNGFICVMHRNE